MFSTFVVDFPTRHQHIILRRTSKSSLHPKIPQTIQTQCQKTEMATNANCELEERLSMMEEQIRALYVRRKENETTNQIGSNKMI